MSTFIRHSGRTQIKYRIKKSKHKIHYMQKNRKKLYMSYRSYVIHHSKHETLKCL